MSVFFCIHHLEGNLIRYIQLAADGVLRLSGALVKYTEQTADGDLKWGMSQTALSDGPPKEVFNNR